MEYYIFYMTFEDKVMPIYCTGIGDDPLVEDHYLFTGVKHLDDKAFPSLKVNAISLPKKTIKYYLKGVEVPIEEKEQIDDESEEIEEYSEEESEEIQPEPPKQKFKRRQRLKLRK